MYVHVVYLDAQTDRQIDRQMGLWAWLSSKYELGFSLDLDFGGKIGIVVGILGFWTLAL